MRFPMHRRRGFTLVELLVVITIIAVIATLAILVAPRFSERQKTSLGASQLQNWLFIAKQRAYRDRLGRGVLLVRDQDNPNYVREAYYIEQPDDIAAGDALAGGNTITFPNPPTDLRNVCGPGDYVSLGDTPPRAVFQIATVPAPNQVTTTTPVTGVSVPSKSAIIRKVRLLEGEPPLKLPQDVVVDLAYSKLPANQPTFALPDGTIRQCIPLMFTKMGGTTGEGVGLGKVIYFVRDSTLDSPLDGEPTLIVVYTRTGFVAAHPVNPDINDLYKFTRDGRSSGL